MLYTQEMFEKIEALLNKVKNDITEILETDDGKYADGHGSFPITYSRDAEPCDGEFGPPIFDPFVIRVTREEDFELPHDRYQFNLKESIEILIDDHKSQESGKIEDKGGIEIAKDLRDAFLELAKMLDDKIA